MLANCARICVFQKLRLRQTEKDAKAANVRLADIGKNVKQDFLETVRRESRDFGARERPGHLAFRIGRLALASNHQQMTARPEKVGNIFCGSWPKGRRQNLERMGFENKIELATPIRGRFEQISDVIFHSGIWEALARIANRGL